MGIAVRKLEARGAAASAKDCLRDDPSANECLTARLAPDADGTDSIAAPVLTCCFLTSFKGSKRF